MRNFSLLSAFVGALLSAPVLAQDPPNVIPGTDVELGLLDSGTDLNDVGRTGTFPNGTNGFAMSTTSCNPGSVHVPWEQAMDPDHPFIAFLIMREEPSSTRLTQISNYSYVKHGFFALSNNQCNYGCSMNSGGTYLAIGCSDTYGVGNNGDRFWLGPAEEIDPWMGTWNPTGSLFDGTPTDGSRSYTGSGLNAVTGRVEIRDADLQIAGARYWYAGYYCIEAEPEGNRTNNMNSREFTATWTGSSYNVVGVGAHLQDTVLKRWAGATVNNGTNNGDGRLYVAHKVTGAGPFHYEYAVHNRDNSRGVSEFRLPIGAGSNVTGAGMHDIDNNPATDWTVTITATEIIFSTATNPLRWNSVFNFWFDADTAPTATSVSLTMFSGGLGNNAAVINTVGPDGGTPSPFAEFCNGDGGVAPGCTPCPCGNNAFPGSIGGCLNSNTSAARLLPSGTPDVSTPADSLHFDMIGGNPSTFGILTSGSVRLPNNPANVCFGLDSGVQSPGLLDGLRCVGGVVIRHGARGTDSNGDIGLTNNAWGPPNNPVAGIGVSSGFTAGQTRHFQVFYREDAMSVCMTGQNTSNAVSVTFL